MPTRVLAGRLVGVAGVLAVFAALYATPITTSLHVFAGAPYAQPSDQLLAAGAWASIGKTVLATPILGLLLVFVRYGLPHHAQLRRWWRSWLRRWCRSWVALVLGPQRATLKTVAASAGCFLVAVAAGKVFYFGLSRVVPAPPAADVWSPVQPATAVALALRAGLSEEIVVLAAPLLALSAFFGVSRRTSPPVVLVVVLALMRLSFHLQYGAGTLMLLPWAIAVPLIFWFLRLTWPLIVAHAVYDAPLMAGGFGLPGTWYDVGMLILGTGLALPLALERGWFGVRRAQ